MLFGVVIVVGCLYDIDVCLCLDGGKGLLVFLLVSYIEY